MSIDLGPAFASVDRRAPAPIRTTVTTTTYRSVLVHLDDSERCAIRVALAIRLAREHGAHLCGIAATGLQTAYAAVESNPAHYKQTAVHRREACGLAVARFERRAKESGVRAFEGRVVDDSPEVAISRASLFADVVIVAQSDPADPERTTNVLAPESVLMDTCRPVVIVPDAGTCDTIGTNVMIAWDDSRAAARAVTDALPFLTRAGRVRIQRLNRPDDGDACSDELTEFLLQHGVTTELHDDQTGLDIGDALLSRAADDECDLLVMGAYGHSRLREVVFGGTTRTVLEAMTVPVLLSRE